MTAVCGTPLGLCAVRVTRLDSLGNVAAGPNNSYVTANQISIQSTPVISAGDDRELKGGCGCIVAAAKLPDVLKRRTLQFVDGALEPAMIEMLLGATLISSGPDPIGVSFPDQVGCSQPQQPNVAIEGWSKNWVGTYQDPNRPWIHWVWPMSSWQEGTTNLIDDFGNPQLDGFTKSNPLWGHGPYGDGVLVGQMGAVFQTAIAPPAGACGYATVTPSS